MNIEESFPSPQQLYDLYPLSSQAKAFIENTRKSIVDILEGRDPRYLLIIGPCSIHNLHSAREYAERLSELSKQYADKVLIVMRTYFEKSRSGPSWQGFINDPHCDSSHDILWGLQEARKFLVEQTQRSLPSAMEILTPHSHPYLGDLLSWASIGARCSRSPYHRQIASACPYPLGIKNPLDGEIKSSIQSIKTAQSPQHFLTLNRQGQSCLMRSQGNPYAHLVLRGSHTSSNCDSASIQEHLQALHKEALAPLLMVDCSHGNSFYDPSRQKEVLRKLLESSSIRGFLVESFLQGGAQSSEQAIEEDRSLTDACLSWEDTQDLLTLFSER